jgi:hypothetical protein
MWAERIPAARSVVLVGTSTNFFDLRILRSATTILLCAVISRSLHWSAEVLKGVIFDSNSARRSGLHAARATGYSALLIQVVNRHSGTLAETDRVSCLVHVHERSAQVFSRKTAMIRCQQCLVVAKLPCRCPRFGHHRVAGRHPQTIASLHASSHFRNRQCVT